MTSRPIVACAAAFLAVAAFAPAAAQAPSTLAQVKQRGSLNCGVDTGLAGFAFKDDKGVWKGLDVDYCRAIAAAIFKDPEKVTYTPLTTKVRFTALKGGDVDVLIRDSTLTFTRGTQLGLDLAGVNFYAGQGFHGQIEPRGQEGDGSRRGHDLHACRSDARAQHRGLQSRQEREDYAPPLRQGG